MLRLTSLTKLIVIASAILGAAAGVYGYFVLDELTLFFAAILYLLSNPHSVIRIDKKFALSAVILTILSFYTLFRPSSVEVGMAQFLRHFYIFICIFFFMIFSKYRYFDAENDYFLDLKFINLLFLLYFSFTLLQGFLAEYSVGNYSYAGSSGILIENTQGRFASQGIWWAGSAYFSIAAFLNLTILVKTPINPLPSLILILFTATYFQSRTLLILVFAFLPLIIFTDLNKKKRFVSAVIILSASLIIAIFYLENIKIILASAIDILKLDPRDSDMDRLEHIMAGFELISGDTFTLVFGNGWQSHKYLLSNVLNNEIAVVRTTGLVALIADTGLLGLTMFFVLLVQLGYRIFISYGPFIGSYLALVSIFSMVGVMFVTNPLDSTLYLLILFGYFVPRKKFIFSTYNRERINE